MCFQGHSSIEKGIGLNGAGAGHGGQGGKGPDHGGGMYYDSVTNPAEFGGPARAGVGSKDDAVGGGILTFTVDNSIIVNGKSSLVHIKTESSIRDSIYFFP